VNVAVPPIETVAVVGATPIATDGGREPVGVSPHADKAPSSTELRASGQEALRAIVSILHFPPLPRACAPPAPSDRFAGLVLDPRDLTNSVPERAS